VVSPVAGASGTSTSGAGAAGAGYVGASGAGGSTVAGAVAAGSGGTGGTGGTLGTTFKRPCIQDGKEVVFIGDSYSNYAIAHRPLASFLGEIAAKEGALMAGDSYRDLAVAGTTLAAPPADIPNQWETAKATKPIKVVVMTGGGNDVLINNQQCRAEGSESKADCKEVVQNSLDTAKKLFTDMQGTGVSDVLYFWYPHIPGGLLTGYERGTSISDYTYPMLEAIAKSASTDTFHVYTVPTVAIFENHPEYFYSDGLHANDTGEAKIAEAIWKAMKDNCIGQAASSGCCMP
jgi:lysophospholipase L1-like esterase